MFEPQPFARPRGLAVVTFSQRCFPTTSDFEQAGWNGIERITSPVRRADPLYAVIAKRP